MLIPDAEPEPSPEIEALQRNVLTSVPADCGGIADAVGRTVDGGNQHRRAGPAGGFHRVVAAFLSTSDKQDMLETPDVHRRLQEINQHLAKELEVQQLRNKIQTEVQDQVQQSQREYYLREQMKAIQKELGEQDEDPARRRRAAAED